MAEVYAAALSHADHNIGRVIDAIDEPVTVECMFTRQG